MGHHPATRTMSCIVTYIRPGLWSRSRRLGLETVSDVPTSRLGLVSRKIVNVSVSGGERLGLELLRLVPIPALDGRSQHKKSHTAFPFDRERP